MLITKESSLQEIEFILNNSDTDLLPKLINDLSFLQFNFVQKDFSINTDQYLYNNPPSYLELLLATQIPHLHFKIPKHISKLSQQQLFNICYLLPTHICLPILDKLSIQTLCKNYQYINEYLLSLIFETKKSTEILILVPMITDKKIVLKNLIYLPVYTFVNVLTFIEEAMLDNINSTHISWEQKNYLHNLLNRYGIEYLSQSKMIPAGFFILLFGLSDTKYLIIDNLDILRTDTQKYVFDMLDIENVYKFIFDNFAEGRELLINSKKERKYHELIKKENEILNLIKSICKIKYLRSKKNASKIIICNDKNKDYKNYFYGLRLLKTDIAIREKVKYQNKDIRIKYKKSDIKSLITNYFITKYFKSNP